MKHLWADRQFLLPLAILGGCMSAVFVISGLQFGFLAISLESGPIENFQLLQLALATLAFAGLAIRTTEADRVMAVGMVALCSIFLVREIDPLSWLPGAALIHDATFKRWFRSAVLIGYGIYLICRRGLVAGIFQYGLSVRAWPLWLSAAFLVIGKICEMTYGRSGQPLWIFLEETFESWGFLTILLAAVWFLRNASRA